MSDLLDLVYTPKNQWDSAARNAFDIALKARFLRVGDLTDRKGDEKRFQLRVNSDQKDGAVPYAALIPSEQELSGPYGGMSFVLFPADETGKPALIAMVIGTNGLAPDEAILGRPGHARKCAAIASWLNRRASGVFAWAKSDPVRIDLQLPAAVENELEAWNGASKKYGKVVYAVFVSPKDRTDESDSIVRDAIAAFVDLFFDERRIGLKKDAMEDAERIRRSWLAKILPTADDAWVAGLLRSRRFVVIEGPPGTGKTELARRLKRISSTGIVVASYSFILARLTNHSSAGSLLKREAPWGSRSVPPLATSSRRFWKPGRIRRSAWGSSDTETSMHRRQGTARRSLGSRRCVGRCWTTTSRHARSARFGGGRAASRWPAPAWRQRIPERFIRSVASVLHAASTTPEPMARFCACACA